MTKLKITIPDMGDFKDVEIIEVLVKEGQTIKKNDSLITLESDKSSVEVPSTHEGKIEKISLKIGDKVNKGDLILTLKTDGQEETKKVVKDEVKKVVKDEVKKVEKPTPKKETSAHPFGKPNSQNVRLGLQIPKTGLKSKIGQELTEISART